MTSLVNNLGGTAGFGEFSLARNDDSSTSLIDVRPIFGAQGINFFGHYYTGFYLNNNGSVTFNTATSSFTPTAITGSTSNPVIAAYWADIDTRGGAVTPSAGGTSTGSNLLWYDLDATTHTFTATWDDVGYYNSQTNKLNAFQISIHEINDQGDFDIIYRYENIDWTTGSASGGSNGLGGTPARAGYSAGNGTEYFELPQSGNQAGLLALESASNVGTPGTFVFSVRNGVPTVGVTVGDASQDEGDGPDAGHVVVPVFLTEPSASTVTVHYSTANGSAVAGQDYVAQSGTLTFAPGVTQQNILVAITGDSVVEGNETFTVTLSDPSVGASILDGTATGTIVDDDASLSIAATSADKAEGQSGTTAFTFTVTRTGDLDGADSAQWTVSGAGVNGADFAGGVLPSGQVSFATGESSKVITVNVAGDTQVEGNETFTVTLSDPGPGATVGTASATGVIRNDDFAPASLSIAATSADKAEGQSGTTAFTFTVTRTDDLSGATSANWAVTGPAVNGADFVGGVLPSGQVSFAAGESSKVITVNVAGDTAVESNESFSVTLSNPSEGAVIGTASAAGVIRNDDASLSIAATSADKAEGQSDTTAFTFTVTRTGDLSGAASAHWAVNGEGVNGADFPGGVLPSGQVSFAAGESSKVITVNVAGDTAVESNESFSVTLSNPSEGAVIGTASAAGIIRNDDASLSIAATSADKAEGQSDSTAFTFTVTRTGDLSGAASAHWAVGGEGVNGADFAGGVLPSGEVSFAAGESSKVITVNVAGDTAVESNESFSVTLSNPSAGAVLGTASAAGVIRNDDASLSIAATSADKAEGQSDSTAFTFTVTRTGDLSGAASASWAVSGPAANAADFAGGELPSGLVSFAAGESSKTITIDVAGDTAVESNEAFSVTLSNPSVGAILGTASASGVIRNDDASLSIAATSADKTEGQSESTAFTFTVTRTGDLSGAASAHWAVGGEGVDDADFAGGVLPSGQVSFAAGESSKVITVDVAGDTAVESNESFSVTLSNPSTGAVIGTASAVGVIRNDDASLSIAATGADKAEGQSGATAFTFTVTRTGDLSGAASAHWTVGGEQVDGADFAGGELPSGQVNFAAGENSKIITIDVAGDTAVESNEAFSVTLSDPSAGAVIGTASASGLIHNDDASLSIAATGADKAEGQSESTAFTFTVTRTGDLSSVASAHWAVDGAGVNGADFAGGVLPSGQVNFAAGESSKAITIDVAGDTAIESNEAFNVVLSDPSAGAVVGTASAAGVIRNDDASLSIAATNADKAEGHSGSTAFSFTVTRTGDLSGAASAQWAVDGAGVNGADFAGGVLPSGQVSFAAGESSKVITIDVAGDTAVESNESFSVTLSDPSAGAVIVTASADGVIRNDDSSLSIAATSADKAEGDIGATAFTFTVTRTGDLSGASTAHWAVGGTGDGPGVNGADLIPSEYLLNVVDFSSYLASFIDTYFPNLSFIGDLLPLPSGTVRFAAGESSKTVTVWALGETVLEGDESFAVTLSNPSPGSVIGTSSAVGTLRNDDGPPAGSVSISDAIVIEGDGGSKLATFTVTRTGGTAAFSVNYATAGDTATVADGDYAAAAGKLQFDEGIDVQTFSVLVYGDTRFEGDEIFFVDLSGATHGAVIDSGTGTGLILDNDVEPAEAFGGTHLDEVGNQFFLRDGDGAGPSLKYLGAAYVDGLFGAWRPIGAEKTADGGYQVAWKFGAADQYVVWNLDGNGNYVGNATGYVTGSDMSLQALETAFQQDLNGNGNVGLATTTIESFGATHLDEVGNQFFLRDGGDAGPSLKYQGVAFTDGLFGAWKPIGAEQAADGYVLAWKNGAADQYVVWNLDGHGNYIGNATGYGPGSDMSLQMLENTFQQDLNGNGHIGPTTTTIESFGATHLDEVGNQFFLRDNGGTGPSLKYQGVAFSEGLFGAWKPIGAEQVDSGYQLAWKNGTADQYVVWNLDGHGNYIGNATGYGPGSDMSLQMLENTFQQDLNGNGHIGPTTTTIESFGATHLDEVGNQFFLRDSGGTGPSLKYQGVAFSEGLFGAWKPIGAEQAADGYVLAWKNGTADQYVVWNLDSAGNYVGNATGYGPGSDMSLQVLENAFHQDLNGNGHIGPTTTTIENFGATRLDEVGNQFFLRDAGGTGPSVKYQGMAVTDGQFGAWTAIGAEQAGSGYHIAWKNGTADQYVVWNLDGAGNYAGNATDVVAGSAASLQVLETAFQQDLNHDGLLFT